MCISLCTHDAYPAHFDQVLLAQTYHQQVGARGWLKGSGSLRLPEIGESLLSEFQGASGISDLGRLLPNITAAGQVAARLLRQPRCGTHPLRHVVLITWLFGGWQEFLAAYHARVPHRAPFDPKSEIAAVSADERITRMLGLIRDRKQSITAAAASVGVDTKTATVWAARAGILTSPRPQGPQAFASFKASEPTCLRNRNRKGGSGGAMWRVSLTGLACTAGRPRSTRRMVWQTPRVGA